jgi:diaminohydroxyphosphoribosylaminopyrimidine deaminase/5-amino-6-(5-phosphoribosylamino)uracil reductase
MLRTPSSAKLFKEPGSVIVVTCSDDEARIDALIQAGAEVLQVANDAGHVDLRAVLKLLATRGCNEVLVEAGPQLAGRMVELGLANQLLIYMAPVVLGSEARSMFAMSSIESMDARWNFVLRESVRIGNDLRLRFRLP